MIFQKLLSDMSGQKVLINANGFEGRYAVGKLVTIEQDFLSIRFTNEAVHYPFSRVLEVSTAREGGCYVPVDRNNRVEVQPEEEGQDKNATVLIKLSEG